MDPFLDELKRYIAIIRQHIDKVLIAASALTILVGAYFTLDYRTYTNCQTQLLNANQEVTVKFSEAMTVILAQPRRPADQQRHALEELNAALQRQRAIQEQLDGCR